MLIILGRTLTAITLSLLIPISVASSHTDGNSFERVASGYLIDIGYDVDVFRAGDEVRFNLNLIDKESGDFADYTDVWITLVSDNMTVLSVNIKRGQFGLPALVYVFPDFGQYEMRIRFQNDTDVLADTSFSFFVQGTEDEENGGMLGDSANEYLLGAFAGFIIGLVVGALMFLNRKSS